MIRIHREWFSINPTIKDEIRVMMMSTDANLYTALVDMKECMLENECYTMLAELRDMEEEYECPIPYKYKVK